MLGKKGFTLIELLAVMAILAILAGLGAKGYSLARRRAKESRARAEIETLRTALNEYRVEHGCYPRQDSPGTLPCLDMLTNAVEGAVLIDPWGNAYQYVCTNRFLYRIWSTGQDANSVADDINPTRTGY